jgi:hypothetical protein
VPCLKGAREYYGELSILVSPERGPLRKACGISVPNELRAARRQKPISEDLNAQQMGRQAPMEPEKLAQSAPSSAFQLRQFWQLQLAGC